MGSSIIQLSICFRAPSRGREVGSASMFVTCCSILFRCEKEVASFSAEVLLISSLSAHSLTSRIISSSAAALASTLEQQQQQLSSSSGSTESASSSGGK